MSSPGRFFATPSAQGDPLVVQPQLASWNAAAHPDQIKLKAFLDHAGQVLTEPLRKLAGPLALRLDVGLPHQPNLLAAHDLDNYAHPLTKALGKVAEQRIVSVWCTKNQGARSTIAVHDALVVPTPTFAHLVGVRTSASAEKVAYKQQIHDQVPRTAMLPAGPITMQIAFTVSPRRNWLNLWKPTIDSLDAMLGRTMPAKDWHPLDGRIVELGLHCTYDAALGNDVELVIGASSAGDNGGSAPRLVDPPATTVSEPELNEFALTYDAYALHGDVSTVGAVSEHVARQWTATGDVGDALDNLRTALFFVQRALRHAGGSPLTENGLVLAILARLRELAPDGVPVI